MCRHGQMDELIEKRKVFGNKLRFKLDHYNPYSHKRPHPLIVHRES